jgi:hypothetical protein
MIKEQSSGLFSSLGYQSFPQLLLIELHRVQRNEK